VFEIKTAELLRESPPAPTTHISSPALLNPLPVTVTTPPETESTALGNKLTMTMGDANTTRPAEVKSAPLQLTESSTLDPEFNMAGASHTRTDELTTEAGVSTPPKLQTAIAAECRL
jgi:hypothetical protein